MGALKKTLEVLTRKPHLAGYEAAFATFPLVAYLMKQEFTDSPTSAASLAKYFFFPITAYFVGSLGAMAVRERLFSPNEIKNYKLDKKSVRAIDEIIEQTPAPQLPERPTKHVPYSFLDTLCFMCGSKESNAQRARKQENPLIAFDAAMRFIEKDTTTGLLLLRDALDWAGHTKPTTGTYAKLNSLNLKLAMKMERLFNTFSPMNNILSGFYNAIMSPEQAWKYTLRAKLMAEQSKPEYKRETAFFHAFIASMQQRSDEQQAWQDTIEKLENSQIEPFGDSRNKVWAIKDSPFFNNTLVFKANPNREALEKERQGTLNLKELLRGEAVVPDPLFVTNKPVNGNYIYVMRRLHGTTLFEQFDKGDKHAAKKALEIIALRHARTPTEGLKELDLAQKTHDKLASVDQALVAEFALPMTPVHEALNFSTKRVNQDSHPGNLEETTNKEIAILDIEELGVHPIANDLANFLNFGEHFTLEEKRSHVITYHNTFGSEKPAHTLLREYWNAEIKRAIDLAVAWKKLPSMRKYIMPLLSRIKETPNYLKQDDRSFYDKHKEHYETIPRCFDKLSAALSYTS